MSRLIELAELIQSRIGQDFDGECRLTEEEAVRVLALLKAQREALEPFAREAKRLGLTEDRDRYSFANTGLSNANLRNARAALEGKQPSPRQGSPLAQQESSTNGG